MRAILTYSGIILAAMCLSCKKAPSKALAMNTTIVETELGARVDSVLTPYLENLRTTTDNNAALAVGITKGDKIIYARTFGYANIEKGLKADLNTVFHIASVSKPFTAAAVVKLIQQGKLKLDDKIIDIVPEFKMKGDNYKNITVKQILTHTSGIPRHVTVDDWNNPVYGPTAPLKNLNHARDFELDFEPGSKFNYSNSGIDILGIVISRASGMTFEDYVKKHILLPAGMTQTHYLKPKDSLPTNWAEAYSYGLETEKWSPFPYTENCFPSGGVHASLTDMCKWGMMHVGKGSFNDYNVLDKEHFELMVIPHSDTPWGDKIGLSWFLQSYLDKPIIMHTGSDSGFEAIMYVYPEEDISIIVMANRDYGRTGRVVNAASEAVFDKELKAYEVSAIYSFAKTYKKHGINAAKEHWESLKKDTTDAMYVSNNHLLSTGAVLGINKKWKESKEILEYYLTFDQNSTFAWRLLGNSNLNLGDTLKAKACYEKTLQINPNYEKGKLALEDLLSTLEH
ncbi:serine hydrolase [Rasiella rasia]|uniref:Serine hydrolase n=1 Tax=Rasiella rasia TaxID=2744027 RepID=A0A6G6GJJ7_9FLAO|nr:serine hydrolase [Rasiella rasia]QIE58766.1 serine hydrolase [Rasiella rasia]